jgi:hypothetical protein
MEIILVLVGVGLLFYSAYWFIDKNSMAGGILCLMLTLSCAGGVYYVSTLPTTDAEIPPQIVIAHHNIVFDVPVLLKGTKRVSSSWSVRPDSLTYRIYTNWKIEDGKIQEKPTN